MHMQGVAEPPFPIAARHLEHQAAAEDLDRSLVAAAAAYHIAQKSSRTDPATADLLV